MKLAFSNLAKKFLKKCQKEDSVRIIKKIELLLEEPFPSEGIKLGGQKENIFRIKIGQYRILYQIKTKEKTILITEIGKRGNIYK